jgi:hypothetical protein
LFVLLWKKATMIEVVFFLGGVITGVVGYLLTVLAYRWFKQYNPVRRFPVPNHVPEDWLKE